MLIALRRAGSSGSGRGGRCADQISSARRFSMAWWYWRNACTRSHPELGRETFQRRWYCVSRRGRVGHRQAFQRRHAEFIETLLHPLDAKTPLGADRSVRGFVCAPMNLSRGVTPEAALRSVESRGAARPVSRWIPEFAMALRATLSGLAHGDVQSITGCSLAKAAAGASYGPGASVQPGSAKARAVSSLDIASGADTISVGRALRRSRRPGFR
jgi:hypothetical protein